MATDNPEIKGPFRFNFDLIDAVENGDVRLAESIERRLEQWLDFHCLQHHHCVVQQTSPQSIPHNVSTKALVNSIGVDFHGWADLSNDRIVPNFPGLYRIWAADAWAASTTTSVLIQTRFNGNIVPQASWTPTTGASSQRWTMSMPIQFNGDTDYADCRVYQTSGAALNLNSVYLMLEYLGQLPTSFS